MMLQQLRFAWIKRHAKGALCDYLSVPLPDVAEDYRSASYVVLDLETTGLTPTEDEIISVGFITIENLRIQLNSAQHVLVKTSKSVAHSAVYHGIVDNQLKGAAPLETIMPRILHALQGRILIVHGRSIDVDFLNAACKRLYESDLPVYCIDTMGLGMRRYQLENSPIPDDGLRLHQLRDLYHLPPYQSHHALTDAIATAELFLALAGSLAGNQPMPVKRLLS